MFGQDNRPVRVTHVRYEDGERIEREQGSLRRCTKCMTVYVETLGTSYALGDSRHIGKREEPEDVPAVPGVRRDDERKTPSKVHDPDMAWPGQ